MKTRFFFVIYLHSETIKTILDGMRIIADPLQRNSSHITVKGPYRNIQKKRLLEDNELIHGKEIRVIGAGNFFDGNQNTVFLKCEDKPELYTIWKSKEEKTYKEFHPHITVYDGSDRSFATKLFETINAYPIKFSFLVDKLDLYSSADKTKLFNLRTQVDYGLLSNITSTEIRQDNIDTLSETQRLTIVDRLCSYLVKCTPTSLTPNVCIEGLREHGICVEG